MSKKNPSVIDYFTPDGQLREEAGEFEGLDLEPFIDKRSKVTPAFSSALMGMKTILFKCRQRKNLTGFIRKVLEIGSWDTSRVHTDFRIHADF